MVGKDRIISFFRKKTRKPVSFREIVKSLDLRPAEARALKKEMRQLVKDGELVRTRRGFYGLAEEMELVTGYFEAHDGGYGFVVQEKPGRRDLFVPSRATLSAMNNDRVVARVENVGRRKGRIVRILERAHARIVGIVRFSGKACFVRPRSRSVPFDVYIAPGRTGGAAAGQRVVVDMIEYPAGRGTAAGQVVKVIDKAEDPVSEVDAIIDEFGFPRRFSKDVVADARRLSDCKPGRRKNLTMLNTITVDGEHARDFGDALSVDLNDHGYVLYVHIADVAHYIAWNTRLDLEARKRATSVYFPDRVIHMLPGILSEDLCSLRPGVERPALTVSLSFDREGNRLDSGFYPSLIMSNERMTYTSVRKILVDNDAGERKKYGYLLRDIELMGELAGLLRENRLRRGSLDFDLPEPEVLLDVKGRPEAIIRAERNFAHAIVEEFMISANEAVGEHLQAAGVPALYRVHEEPDPVKLEEVFSVSRAIGYAGAGKSMSLHKLLESMRGTTHEEAVTYLALRALKQARYSTENVGHYGLASECYTHFTSPIRRYPDLVVHRILRGLISGKGLSDKRVEELRTILPDIAFNSSRRERASDEAEREAVKAMRVWFMKDRVGEEFSGKIVSVGSFGLRVRLEDYYVEGLLHISSLTDDYYLFDEESLSLRGRHGGNSYGFGQSISVRLDMVDMEEREMFFGIPGLLTGPVKSG
jgi:ribonuclease R